MDCGVRALIGAATPQFLLYLFHKAAQLHAFGNSFILLFEILIKFNIVLKTDLKTFFGRNLFKRWVLGSFFERFCEL